MMGHLSGVATQIMKEEPTAVKVHCFAHCLNLCLQDAAKKCNIIRDALSLIMEIAQLILYSPKRSLVFENVKKDTSPNAPGLRPLCPTRWTVRTGAIHSVLANYGSLLEAFTEINSTSHDDYGRRAGGVLAQMEMFKIFFGLKLSFLIFSATEQVSVHLQRKDITLQEALASVKMANQHLQRQRSDAVYQEFYAKVVKCSEDHTNPPSLPRYRRPPKKLDDGAAPTTFQTPEDMFRKTYFEVIDLVQQELMRRFDQKSLEVPILVENLLLKAANWDGKEELEINAKIADFYNNDIDVRKLKRQMYMLPELVQQQTSHSVKKVTNVATLIDIFQNSPVNLVGMFSEIGTLLRIFITVPISTATAERSFSALRRIKTYLRSTMTQERLNNVMLLHCHKDRTDALELETINKEFMQSNEQRRNYFGC
jgi:hypothetical protein